MGTDRHEHLVPRSLPATSEVSSHGAVEADPLCSQPSKLRSLLGAESQAQLVQLMVEVRRARSESITSIAQLRARLGS